MRIIATTLLVMGAIVLILLSQNGQLRSLHPASELGLLEPRITSVPAEAMRRSPELTENFVRFETCDPEKSCDRSEILDEREEILKKIWPALLRRLSNERDWGEGSITKLHHQKFIADLKKAGGKEKAKSCLPRIHYYVNSEPQIAVYSYQGIRCFN